MVIFIPQLLRDAVLVRPVRRCQLIVFPAVQGDPALCELPGFSVGCVRQTVFVGNAPDISDKTLGVAQRFAGQRPAKLRHLEVRKEHRSVRIADHQCRREQIHRLADGVSAQMGVPVPPQHPAMKQYRHGGHAFRGRVHKPWQRKKPQLETVQNLRLTLDQRVIGVIQQDRQEKQAGEEVRQRKEEMRIGSISPDKEKQDGQLRGRQGCRREVDDISRQRADDALEGSHKASPPRENLSDSWPSSQVFRAGSGRPESSGSFSESATASAMISSS